MKAAPDDPSLKPIIEGFHDVPPELLALERLAWLMDRAFQIPGTPIRVGLDAILGLLPIGGDALTGLIQIGLVVIAVKHFQVPRAIAARMAANVFLDTTVGAIPFVGDAFDATFKANTRNVALLKTVYQQRRAQQPVATASSILFVVALAASMLAVLALALVGFVAVVAWVWKRVS